MKFQKYEESLKNWKPGNPADGNFVSSDLNRPLSPEEVKSRVQYVRHRLELSIAEVDLQIIQIKERIVTEATFLHINFCDLVASQSFMEELVKKKSGLEKLLTELF